jgi:threonine dehydrogenase-like Zn-dependent dehydrogenase
MADDKLERYKHPDETFPDHNTVWPLYGAGFENLGRDGHMIDVPMPEYSEDELLVRHDATGLCFSDIKVIKQGEDHPRIYRKMGENPVVLGHEVAMTVVGVGDKLRDQYKVGDRFTIQADIYINGVGYAYGYEIQGGMSRFGLIDQRVLNGDGGNYLLPVKPTTGYAESALTEPWACVVAAYSLHYRTQLKPKGTTWIIGVADDPTPYTLDAGFDTASHPNHLILTHVPAAFAADLKARAAALGVQVIEADDIGNPGVEKVDDIILLGAHPDAVEGASPRLADGGVFAIITDQPLPRKVDIDMGRVHYNRWVYVGGTTPDIARAYSDVPVRAEFKAGGRAWFVGAAGPMGRMHVQRAIQVAHGPALIVCTDVSEHRLQDLYSTFAAEAQAKGVEFVCINPTQPDGAAKLADYKVDGFDDVIVLAPVPALIADSATYLAPQGVMNVFAGVGRGTMVNMDISDVYLKGVRYIGQSGSLIEDLKLTLSQAESGELSTNRAVAAIGSLSATKKGLEALRDAVYPGKVVIYPHIKEMPLTSLPELKEAMPTVYAKLKDGREWTNEAEAEFLRLMLE